MVWRVCAHTSVGSSRSFALSFTDQLFRGLSTQHPGLAGPGRGPGRGGVLRGCDHRARSLKGAQGYGDIWCSYPGNYYDKFTYLFLWFSVV